MVSQPTCMILTKKLVKCFNHFNFDINRFYMILHLGCYMYFDKSTGLIFGLKFSFDLLNMSKISKQVF